MNVEANSSVEAHIGERAAFGIDDPNSAGDAGGGAVAASRSSEREMLNGVGDTVHCCRAVTNIKPTHVSVGVCGHLGIFTHTPCAQMCSDVLCVHASVCA